MARDYEKEIATLNSQVLSLDDSAKETMLLEQQLEKDLGRLEGELGTPAVALDKKAFAKVNAEIEATHTKLATAKRSMTAISKARGELVVMRDNVDSAKHLAAAQEYSRSANEMGKALDEDVLPELRETVDRLAKYIRAGSACMHQAGARHAVGARTMSVLAMTFAKVFRDLGFEVTVSEAIRTGVSNYDGYATIADALAEFQSAVETPNR